VQGDGPPGPAPAPRRRGIPAWLGVALAAVVGVLIGRVTKRDEYVDD
jgi:hypothetical protein